MVITTLLVSLTFHTEADILLTLTLPVIVQLFCEQFMDEFIVNAYAVEVYHHKL